MIEVNLQPALKRECGSCQTCCKLMPVEEIAKPALQRCKHQKSALGCTIYPRRPMSCRIWSCAWLTDHKTVDLPRPDRSHYVIDIWPDSIYLNITTPRGNERVPQAAIQVWCDPNYPDAWDNPKLKAYLDSRGMPVIIRYGNDQGFVLFPPSYGNGEWVRHDTKPEPREFLLDKNRLYGQR
jgi:hypothetical protein